MSIPGRRWWVRRGDGASTPGRLGEPSAVTVTRPDARRRAVPPRRRHKARRLAQAAMFSAVRGAAYALGGAASAWVLYWIAQHWPW